GGLSNARDNDVTDQKGASLGERPLYSIQRRNQEVQSVVHRWRGGADVRMLASSWDTMERVSEEGCGEAVTD
ncbi:MAG: hypothetical protein NTW86_12045, partial [Candidatus Sumerlaeota bacterium]|nr:hypothetical protein [Candidatus Sumerlaeota bacterium]